MVNSIRLLSWDSAFFSKKIGQVLHLDALGIADFDEYDLVTLKLNTDSYRCITRAHSLGFSLVESEVVFSKQVSSVSANEISGTSIAAGQDIEKLKEIAAGAYSLSRYRLPYFDDSDRERFYSTWIENAVTGEFDDICLVVREQSEVTGYISLKKDSETLNVGLIAVAEGHQGKGIAKRLLSLAEVYAQQKSCNRINVATQVSNIPAINLYLNAGFYCKETSHWFYRGKV